MEDKKAAYDKEFREGVVNYKREHPDETFVSIGKKFGVHSSTVGKWYRDAETRGEVVVRGSGNYESDEAKEIAHLKKELRDYKDAVEVLKSYWHTGKIANQNIYEAVTDAKSRKPGSFSVASVLAILGISRSDYYYYMNHEMTKTEERRMKVTDSVVKIFNESGQLYGSPKIAALINRSGEDKVSQKYVLGIMKKLGIKPKYIRHRTITTVSRNFSSELKNILHRHFNPEKPDAFWCTDITYIWTYDDGFVYLASVMDLYSRKIVGWCVTRTMDANVVLECIEMAKRRRGIDHPVVIHSDRGVQYTSEAYRKATEGMVRSYSKKGTPWDNACIESWHSLLKRECIRFHKIMNYHEAKSIIFSYIEGFYNTVRIHSHCEYQSPDEYEEEYYEKEVNNIIASNEIVEVVA